MTLPKPEPGLVIRYGYLWSDEYETGREVGSKDRPCAIVACVRQANDELWVTVLPVTHSIPRDASLAIEIPPTTKKRLGLDFDRSWIVISEGNEFKWPGPDIRPAKNDRGQEWSYGFLPHGLTARLREKLLELDRLRRFQTVPRTE